MIRDVGLLVLLGTSSALFTESAHASRSRSSGVTPPPVNQQEQQDLQTQDAQRIFSEAMLALESYRSDPLFKKVFDIYDGKTWTANFESKAYQVFFELHRPEKKLGKQSPTSESLQAIKNLFKKTDQNILLENTKGKVWRYFDMYEVNVDE